MNNQRAKKTCPTELRTLNISTAHMPSSEPNFGTHSAYSFLYGYFMYVCFDPCEDHSNEPGWITKVLSYAHKNSFDMIVFDADASVDIALPTFDWDKNKVKIQIEAESNPLPALKQRRFLVFCDGILAGHVSGDSHGYFEGDLEYKYGDCVYLCQIHDTETLKDVRLQFEEFIDSVNKIPIDEQGFYNA